MTSKNHTDTNQQQRKLGSAFRKESPNTLNAFLSIHKAPFAPGAMKTKHKELIAVAIAVNVTILMGGGPAVIYGAQALAAVVEFCK